MVFAEVHDAYAKLPPSVQLAIVILLTAIAATLLVWILRRTILAAAHRAPHVDDTLERFAASVLTATGVVVVIVAVLLVAGVPAAALGGVLAVVGFVVGFALQDTLGNLAAGVMLLLNRPYSVGEAVEVKGHDGVVLELGIATTRLKTYDGRLVTIPNGSILKEPILNHTRNPTRRAAIEIAVSYGDDLERAIETALSTANGHPDVLRDPAPDVLVKELGADGVELQVRAWIETTKFHPTSSDLRRRLKAAVEGAGMTIPYPQRDVHLYAETGEA